MCVEDLTTTCRTGVPGDPAAASRFRVPMTFVSWRDLPERPTELVSKKVWTTVSTWVACTMRCRIV